MTNDEMTPAEMIKQLRTVARGHETFFWHNYLIAAANMIAKLAGLPEERTNQYKARPITRAKPEPKAEGGFFR